jgi:hypothetical protein
MPQWPAVAAVECATARPRWFTQGLNSLTVNRPAALLALLLTAALFLFAGRVVSASMFGAWHDAVHVATYVTLALLYAQALPHVHWRWIVLGAFAIGGLHELYQFVDGRGRFGFEYDDFLLNALGAALGGCLRFVMNAALRS